MMKNLPEKILQGLLRKLASDVQIIGEADTVDSDNFAIRAFKVTALDYILKPIDQIELSSVMNKVRHKLIEKEKLDLDQIVSNWKNGENRSEAND